MIVTLATFAMGTRFEFVLAGEDEPQLRAAGEEALAEIDLWHRRLNYFARDSLVTRINTRAASQAVALDAETFALIQRCVQLNEETGGAFDITMAPLMRTWGFRSLPSPVGRGVGGEGVSGSQHISLDHGARTIRFTHPDIEIDLGGIAKGFALDCSARILRNHGVKCALLHGGTSSAVALSAPPNLEGWMIRIASPSGLDRVPARIDVYLRDQSLSISAPHGRTVEHNGETLGHIIDPRTGSPARGADLAAAICESATDAEAWSTALLVLNERPETLPDKITSILYDSTRGWRVGGTVPVHDHRVVAQG